MLDDDNVIRQRDPAGALGVASEQWQQATFAVEVQNPENDGRQIQNIVVAGMGGSALAALLAKSWLSTQLAVSFEVVRTYNLPDYVNFNTLVIASSYSGNTEETLSTLAEAREKGAQVAVVASGGELLRLANEHNIAAVALPSGIQPRMSVIYNLRALTALFSHFNVLPPECFAEIADTAPFLEEQTGNWLSSVSTDKNLAKQLALMSVGKTPVIYASNLMAPIAYKWKISWNENAKNVAVWNEYPEMNHNEFIGWTSHPIEKPFAVFNLRTQFDHERIQKRFEISDRLLSGQRPKAQDVWLEGESILRNMLYGCILADFVSTYVALLNNVDPTPVPLIEKLKVQLND